VLCNQRVKFRDLLQTARDLGADALATGHYVRRMDGAGGPELHRATDAERDQSYFLFATTREQLAFLRFPLGGLRKDETRAIAARLDLGVADKPDSQDICFVPSGGYAAVVSRLRPGAAEPGDIVHVDGRVLGRHDGIVNFTIGQRRGLRLDDSTIENGAPLYVVRLDSVQRKVVVGPKSALAIDRLFLRDVNWLEALDMAGGPQCVTVKLRSTMPPVAASIRSTPEGAEVGLLEPQFGVAPGQACVIYIGDRVLGGGWIARSELVPAA
jgi:tRNA-specific 2-thiouridylase